MGRSGGGQVATEVPAPAEAGPCGVLTVEPDRTGRRCRTRRRDTTTNGSESGGQWKGLDGGRRGVRRLGVGGGRGRAERRRRGSGPEGQAGGRAMAHSRVEEGPAGQVPGGTEMLRTGE
jgi:hypothetical protein